MQWRFPTDERRKMFVDLLSRRVTVATLLIVASTLLDAGSAYAYLDPGTASIVLQGILAFFGAIAAGFAFYFRSLLNMFKRNRKKVKSDLEPQDKA
jgi:hypothetical protein